MVKPDISVLCPTRGRPRSARDLIKSASSTADWRRIQFVFYVDNDDPSLARLQRDIANWHEEAQRDTVKMLVGPRITLSDMWNRCFEQADADIVMQCGDDIRFRTPGWDKIVLEHFDRLPDKIGLVYGKDGIQNERVATHGFVHRRWVETVGYFTPPMFASDYGDLWLTEVAKAVGRLIYEPRIYTEHLHPVANKWHLDKTHQERLARHTQENVDLIWKKTRRQRADDVLKLKAVMDVE